jgi:hypothetical protein
MKMEENDDVSAKDSQIQNKKYNTTNNEMIRVLICKKQPKNASFMLSTTDEVRSLSSHRYVR